MDTHQLLEDIIYPRLSAKVIFSDLNGLKDSPNGRGIVADCPRCGKKEHFFCYHNGKYGFCQSGRCEISKNSRTKLSWWDHTAERFGLRGKKDILRKLADLAGVDLSQYCESRQCKIQIKTVEEARRHIIQLGQKATATVPPLFSEYLKKRGFDADLIKKSGVIYMEREKMIRVLFDAGITKELLTQTGITTVGFGETYKLLLPLSDEKGQCIGFIGRLNPDLQPIDGEQPKYKNSRGLSKDVPYLYHVANQPGNHKIVVVEGPFDALLITYKCDLKGVGVIAACGDAFGEQAISLLNNSSPRIFVLAMDDDRAGHLATAALVEKLKKQLFVIPNFSGFKDPGEMIPVKGVAKFKELLFGAIPFSMWLFQTHLLEAIRQRGAGGRVDILAGLAPVFQNMGDNQDREVFVKEARKATLLHVDDIKAAIGG